MAGGAVAAGGVDFLHDRRGRTHRQAAAAILLRDRQTEDTHFAHGLDHIHGDQLVAQMPAVGLGGDMIGGEATELFTDQCQGLVQTQFAELGPARGLDQHPGQAIAAVLGVADVHQVLDRRAAKRRQIVLIETQISRAHDLDLAHGDAIGHLRQIAAKTQLQQ